MDSKNPEDGTKIMNIDNKKAIGYINPNLMILEWNELLLGLDKFTWLQMKLRKRCDHDNREMTAQWQGRINSGNTELHLSVKPWLWCDVNYSAKFPVFLIVLSAYHLFLLLAFAMFPQWLQL